MPAELLRAAAPALDWRFAAFSAADRVKVGELEIDTGGYEAFVRDRKLDLTHQEFELLKFLAQNRGKVWTREQLLSKVWGYRYFGGTRTPWTSTCVVCAPSSAFARRRDDQRTVPATSATSWSTFGQPGTMTSSAAQCVAPNEPSTTSPAVVEVERAADVAAAADVDDAAVELVAGVAIVVARQAAGDVAADAVAEVGPAARDDAGSDGADAALAKQEAERVEVARRMRSSRTPGSTAVTMRNVPPGPSSGRGAM